MPAKRKKGKALAKKPAKKTTGVTTKPEVGELVPQPHGGALRYGGTNKGGPGRPKDMVKELARKATLDVVIPRATEIAKGEDFIEKRRKPGGVGVELEMTPSLRDQLSAMKLLSDLGKEPIPIKGAIGAEFGDDGTVRRFTITLGEVGE